MSRSYKKTPRAGDRKGCRSGTPMKVIFNRALRHKPISDTEPSTSNRSLYRKQKCSWDICDYQEVGTTFQQYWSAEMRRYHRTKLIRPSTPIPSKAKAYREWFKMYKAK